jgi:TPR repeat protein
MNLKLSYFLKRHGRWINLPLFFFYITLFYSSSINATDLEAGKAAYLDRNYENAIKIFKPLAKKGNSEAQHYLKLMREAGYRDKTTYKDGKAAYLKNDFKLAFEILKPLADEGNSWSQYILSLMYESGQGVEKNQKESVKWLILAAESGVPKIQYDLGIRYFYGYGIEQNFNEAAKWWESSANAGIADSQYNLGLMYYRGIGVSKDKNKARILIKKAASQDHDKAQHRLAMIYALDDEDFLTSLSWLRASAKQNNTEAQYNLGVFHEKGYGVSKDLDKAKEWYQLAADQGLEVAIQKIQALKKKDNNINSSLENITTDNSKKDITEQKILSESPKDKLNLTNWLREQSDDKYTLQLASVVKKEAIIDFIENGSFDGKIGFIEVMVNGITRYAAIYGLYHSYADAKREIPKLPSSIKTKPWIRKVEVIKKILK